MTHSFDIVIVGAGMVGASAALALSRQGHSIALIENGQEMTFSSNDSMNLRVSAISPSSEHFLAKLGIWPLIESQRYCSYSKMTVWDENSEGSLHFDAASQASTHLGHIIENNLIIYALHQQLKHAEKIDVFWQDRVKTINNEDDKVSVVLNSNKTISAKLLIAADGKNSSTRQFLDIKTVSNSYQQHAIVANVKTEFSHEHTAWQRFLSTGPLAFLPLDNGESSIVWSCDNALSDELISIDDTTFNQHLAEAFEHKLGRVTLSSQRAKFPLSWQYAEQTIKNRCVLIGDAAHSIHPLAGQGVNLGFSDAELLSSLLTTKNLINPRKVLRRYERQRKYDTSLALHGMTAINDIFKHQNSFVSQIRSLGMNFIEQNMSIKREIIQSASKNISI